MFKPKGKDPLWKMVYDKVVTLQIGDVINYDELSEIIDDDIMKNRGAIYKARKKLLKEHKRFLIVERGNGFKVVEGIDIMDHAEGRHAMAELQIKSAGFEVSNINTVTLTPDDKKKLHDFMAYNANIRAAFKQTVTNIEKASQVTQIAQAFTESEIKKLKEMIGEK